MNQQARLIEALMNQQLRRWRADGAQNGAAAPNGGADAANIAAGLQGLGLPPQRNRMNDDNDDDDDVDVNMEDEVDADDSNAANANGAEADDGAANDARPGGDANANAPDAPLDLERVEDGAYEGGVARGSEKARDATAPTLTKSTECELIFYIECEEALEAAPNHPIIKPGVTVAIGSGRHVKLAAVFNKYVEFSNSVATDQTVSVDMLEFTHCRVLDKNNTAEVNALMKNDRIMARRVRAAEREAEADRKRRQRVSDREYFKQLKHLMPELGGARVADIILDCRGTLADENGRNQQVLCTTVKAHSAILKKRCKWFADIIGKATRDHGEARKKLREQQDALNQANHEAQVVISDQGVQIQPMQQGQPQQQQHQQGQQQQQQPIIDDDGTAAAARIGDDVSGTAHAVGEDGIASLNFQPDQAQPPAHSGATAIVNDDDDDDDDDDASCRGVGGDSDDEHSVNSGSPLAFPRHPHSMQDDLVWVPINNHSPESVKLLLEYCYTNRVAPLGYDAHAAACITRPHKAHDANSPRSINGSQSSCLHRWPSNRHPSVTFAVVLDAISLAEEASMKRFSLMCEVAASRLLDQYNVVEALMMCTLQEKLTGNGLPRLRKAAMDILLRHGSHNVSQIERATSLTKVLKDDSAQLLPTLLKGMLETLTKKDMASMDVLEKRTTNEFLRIDKREHKERERERKRRRMERRGYVGSSQQDSPRGGNNSDLDDRLYQKFKRDVLGKSSMNIEPMHPRSNSSIVPHEDVPSTTTYTRSSSKRQRRNSRRNAK